MSVELRLILDDDQVGAIASRVAEILRGTDPAPGNQPRYLTTEQAATYLGTTVGRIEKLVQQRRIPYVQEAVGCRLFFDRVDLDTWMRTMRHEAR